MSLERRSTMLLLAWLAWWVMPASAAGPAGYLVWPAPLVAGTPITGTVRTVEVEVGDRVAAGDVLVRLDDRGLRARELAARSAVAEYKLAYDEASREWERAQELYERTVLSDHDLQLARVSFSAAESRYRQAQAELTMAGQETGYATVRAPAAGYVVRLPAYPGQAVVNLRDVQPLAYVQAEDRMGVRVPVVASELGGMYPGARVVVNTAGQRWPAVITAITPVAGGGEARFHVDAEFSVENLRGFAGGQAATLELP